MSSALDSSHPLPQLNPDFLSASTLRDTWWILEPCIWYLAVRMRRVSVRIMCTSTLCSNSLDCEEFYNSNFNCWVLKARTQKWLILNALQCKFEVNVAKRSSGLLTVLKLCVCVCERGSGCTCCCGRLQTVWLRVGLVYCTVDASFQSVLHQQYFCVCVAFPFESCGSADLTQNQLLKGQ